MCIHYNIVVNFRVNKFDQTFLPLKFLTTIIQYKHTAGKINRVNLILEFNLSRVDLLSYTDSDSVRLD